MRDEHVSDQVTPESFGRQLQLFPASAAASASEFVRHVAHFRAFYTRTLLVPLIGDIWSLIMGT